MILNLQNASKTLFKWFNDNQVKANPDKCHFISSFNIKKSIMIENEQLSSCMNFLGVSFDSKLKFQWHIDNIFKKAWLSFHASV